MFLRKHKAEVSSILFDFDMKEYVKRVKRDSYEDGLLEGKELGRLEGKELGRLEGIELGQVRSVDSLMENYNMDLQKACEGIGITVEEYEDARKRDLK